MSRSREHESIDMTPMVDVTFLLLVFFMVTAALALQKSLELPLRAEERAGDRLVVEPEPPEYITVVVDETNSFRVITSVWASQPPGVQDLHIDLREARRRSGLDQLLVKASGEALHERVVAVLDAGTAVGMKEILLVTLPDDDPED